MRARNIKPGFFENEILAKCNPLARILFSGLWCYADREGRFEWRPERIKALILPYDNCDIEQLLGELIQYDFIKQYNVMTCNYGIVLNFKKHQNPHPHEAQSKLPEYNQCQGESVTLHGMSRSRRADSLIPDSLIPDSKDPASPVPPKTHFKEKLKTHIEEIETLCRELKVAGWPKVYSWVQSKANGKIKAHPRAIIESLSGTLKAANEDHITSHWAYAEVIFKKRNYECFYQDDLSQANQDKIDFNAIIQSLEKVINHK